MSDPEINVPERLTPPDDPKLSKIEDRLDPQHAGAVAISVGAGGLDVMQMRDVMEFAKLMSIAAEAVPPHLRGRPGVCLAVTVRAVEWRMSPFAVAEKTYLVNNRLGYESQLVHAVIESRAPLAERLICTYSGEGADRRCIVSGKFKGGAVRDYESPMIKDIKVKNSPLWSADPDQQLWYYASRAWARKWCPDVIMGIYTRDELADAPVLDPGEVVSTGLLERLPGKVSTNHGPETTEMELASAQDPDPDGLKAKEAEDAKKAAKAAEKAAGAASKPRSLRGRRRPQNAPAAASGPDRLV